MEFALAPYYEHIAAIHGLTGFVGKVALISVIGAIFGGNVKPGNWLFPTIIGLQLAISGYNGFTFALSDQCPDGIAYPLLLVSVVCFGVAVACGVVAASQKAVWDFLPDAEWRHYLGFVLFAWAVWYPPFSNSVIKSVFFSPVGILPHMALLVGTVGAWLSLPKTDRTFLYAMLAGSVVVGLIDVALGITSSFLLLAVATLASGEFALNLWKSGPVRPQAPRQDDSEDEPKAPQQPKPKRDQKQWKLK